MVVQQTRVTPVADIETTDDKPSLERLDLYIRYIMIAVGCLPASCIPGLPKPAKLILVIAQLLMVIVLFIPPVNALFAILEHRNDQDLSHFIYSILVLEASFLTPFDALLFSLTGNIFNTFKDYYEQLAVVQKCFREVKIDIPQRLLRVVIILLAITGILFSCTMDALFLHEYIHRMWNLDPLFAPEINDTNLTELDNSQITMRGMGQFYVLTVTTQLSLKVTYFTTVSIVLFLLFRSFNKNLEKIVKNNPDKLQQDLSLYRNTHLELCRLVENMNRVFRAMLGAMLLMYGVGLLLIFYLVSLGFKEDSEIKKIMIFWCLMLLFFEFMTIASCQLIQDQTVEAKEPLLRLSVTHTEGKVEEFEFSLFLEQVREPTTLTAAGVVAVNKDFGLTIAGFILTYYILMAQISSSMQGTECLCVCAVYNLTTTPL